jgi:WD40 repeat protein
VETGEEERKLEGHSSWVNSVSFSADGSRVVSGSDDNTVQIWNVETGEVDLPESQQGHVKIDQSDSPVTLQEGYWICSDVTQSQCWIPHHDISSISSNPYAICFGLKAGQVLVLKRKHCNRNVDI